MNLIPQVAGKAVLLALLFAAAAPSQQGTHPNKQFALEVGDLRIEDLVRKAAGFLEINILLAPQELAGTQAIQLQRGLVTDRDGCEDLLSSLLYRCGFAYLPIDPSQHLYEVVSLTGTRSREVALRSQRKTADEILKRPGLYMPVLVSVPLEHINSQIAMNSLRPFLATSGGQNSLTIGTPGNTNFLLVMGMQSQVAQLLHLLRECDVPQKTDPAREGMEERLARLEGAIVELQKALAAKK